MRCEHPNLTRGPKRGYPCPNDATHSGRIDGRHMMWVCPRHASGWVRTATGDAPTVVRL